LSKERAWELEYLHYLQRFAKSLGADNEEDIDYGIRKIFLQTAELSVEEVELTERMSFCIDSLTAVERYVIKELYEQKCNITKAGVIVGIPREQVRKHEKRAWLNLFSLRSSNVLLYGIEEGTKRNSQLKESIKRKYKEGIREFLQEERMYLSVRHSRLEDSARNALLRAKVRDFSEFFSVLDEIKDYKGIGEQKANVIREYVEKDVLQLRE